MVTKEKQNAELFDLCKKAAAMKQIEIASFAKDCKKLLEEKLQRSESKSAFGFLVTQFCLFWDCFFFIFIAKKLQFCSLFQFSDFMWFSIWLLVFIKNTQGFSKFFSSFSSIWAVIKRLHCSRAAAKCKCYWEECVPNHMSLKA